MDTLLYEGSAYQPLFPINDVSVGDRAVAAIEYQSNAVRVVPFDTRPSTSMRNIGRGSGEWE